MIVKNCFYLKGKIEKVLLEPRMRVYKIKS